MKSLSLRREAERAAQRLALRVARDKAVRELKANTPLDEMTTAQLRKVLWFDATLHRFMWKYRAPPPKYTRLRVAKLTWRREIKGILYRGKFYPFDTLLALWQGLI
jgi:hypothetical protein